MTSALAFANSTDFNLTASASADRNRITAEPGFSSSNPGLANVEAALLLPERRLDVCPVTRPGLRWQRPSPLPSNGQNETPEGTYSLRVP
jgi:hypothetical protein